MVRVRMGWRKNRQNHPCGNLLLTRQRMRRWYDTPLGKFLATEEFQQLDAVICNLFGYHLVQVGKAGWGNSFGGTRVPHCVIVDQDYDQELENTLMSGARIGGVPDALPIASDMVDVVTLPHVLEFVKDPHQVLREVDRILIPEGHVVILGYNPLSFWYFARVLLGWRRHPPWCGRFFSVARIKDWLSLLGFDIAYTRFFFYRPPVQHMGIIHRLAFVERLGNRLWPIFGGLYIVVAKKKVVTLTPIKPRWRPRRSFIPAGVVETQNRNNT